MTASIPSSPHLVSCSISHLVTLLPNVGVNLMVELLVWHSFATFVDNAIVSTPFAASV